MLEALEDGGRGFDAVVVGEPQRVFYDNQFGLIFPLFVHFKVALWVPEVGGALDADSEANCLIMSMYAGMSKAERRRIQIRVRAAMAAQAEFEGRFLGGRPPYGYRLADEGPHTNPAMAALGAWSHRLETDPQAAPIVEQIFALRLTGYGARQRQHRAPGRLNPHQSLENARPLLALPSPITDPNQITQLKIRRRQRLGGILNEYQHAA